MKQLFTLSLLSIFSLMTLQTMAQQPDLIDRKIFFDDPEITGGQLSPDGKYLTFLRPYEGIRNIWVKGIHEPFESAKPITNDKNRPIAGYFWSRDGKYVLYVQDKGGDENYHVYAVDPSKAGAGIPEARNITDVDGVRAAINRVPRSNPDVMIVGLNDRDASYHDLYEINIATGNRKLLFENTEKIAGWDFDNEDKIRMAARTADDGSTEILTVMEDGSFKTVYTCSINESAYINGFHKDNKKAYLVTNKGDLNLSQLMSIDPMTGETELVEADPEGKVDFGGMVRSDITHEIQATVYVDSKTRVYFRDKMMESDYNLLKKRFNNAEINFGSNTKDESMYLISVNSDVDPGTTYLFDRKTKTTVEQYKPRPNLPLEALSPMTAITYKSSDGLEIPAYLTLPKGVEAKNLPAIVMPHGGPWARDYWGYDSYAQFFANRGYAVLQMNFRGSTGYGKEFLNAGDGEWGKKMQDDVTYGAQYLAEKGIANAEKIAILGGSYGGYATLAGVAFTPDVYAAGVSIVGPSNLITLLESIPPYWESFRKIMYARMGDPNTEEGAKWLYERSPLNSANKIKTPLMVVQGANDPRVKKAESDQIVVAMRELGLPVEYIVADDEGHGFSKPVNNMAFLAAAEKFLAKHVGGRYQPDMPEDVAKRLEEITMDVKYVELPKELSMNAMTADLPMSSGVVMPGKSNYAITIEMGPQKIPMTMEQSIVEGTDGWEISEVSKTPMGDMSSTYYLDKKTLLPTKMEFTQGPAKGEIVYTPTSAIGFMEMNGNKTDIKSDLDASVLGDGGAMGAYLASLDLEPGMTANLRTFDMQLGKVKHISMTVGDKEEVTVAAGTFAATKVELKPADGSAGEQIFWIDMTKKRVVKMTAVLAEMGGALMSSELAE